MNLSPTNDKILIVSDLSKKFGRIHAVNQLSFEVIKGSVFGILGPNGSGKTTTLGMLLDTIIPTSGIFNWFDTFKNENHRTRIGSLLEKPNFYDYLSATDNLKIIAEIRGYGHQDIDEVLTKVNLYERRKSKFSTFSLGMKQRLAIGAAILGNPEVLILDEPTNGLDPYGIAEVRNLILDLSTQGKTIIIASHLLDEVQKICSYVLVMKRGQNLFCGSIDSLTNHHHKIEISSNDLPLLKSKLLDFTGVLDIKEEKDCLVLDTNPNLQPEKINEYLFQNGIILSHLNYRKLSLEKQILEILDATK